ncbi:MAG TPA: hypothetical protein VGO00_09850, partial [Kofleriaceae bacterium]|nr:hypothetical protein [Kofleriaceae bacterium]
PGPVIADRILAALLGATDASGVVERPHVRGLCDVEIDLVGALLWHLMPPSGWRLPATGDVELVHVKLGRLAVEIGFGPTGARGDTDPGLANGWRQRQPIALAAAHDLMHTVDQQLRDGHYEDAMRGYRVLLAAGGPDQPVLLERILAVAAARPGFFFDGLELARQALGRWPQFPAAHAALASITLAQGDAREAADHLAQLAHLASAEGDDDQAALAALAGARLVRLLEPKHATELYALALEHDPASTESADALADRLADEQRWPELVRLARARAVTSDVTRAVQLRLRLADVFVRRLGDTASAEQELAIARRLAPDDPAVHEMTATILATENPAAAADAWRDVARIAETRGDHATSARAHAILGGLVAGDASLAAWKRALELDPLQPDALVGLATLAASRGDNAAAAELFERLRELELPPHDHARHELALARCLVELGRNDDARASLRRTALAGGELAAEAHAVLAEIAEAASDREHSAAELDTAITALVELATAASDDRLHGRAAELAAARAALFDRSGNAEAATIGWERAHELAGTSSPEIARVAARTLLSRAGDDARSERRWIDAVLATRPPPTERAALLVERAGVRRRESTPDVAAAIADLREALSITEGISGDVAVAATRRQAYQLEADLLAASGDQRARARALAALAKASDEGISRVEAENTAAAAWLAADEPAAALPHAARAHVAVAAAVDLPPELRRDVLVTLGEAAWRQRAWPDVIRAYVGLIAPARVVTDETAPDAATTEHPRAPTFRYRLAVAAERTNDNALALATLSPFVNAGPDAAPSTGITPEVRGQALRLYADLAERSGDLAGAASALEAFAALGTDTSTSSRGDAMYRAGELFRRAEVTGTDVVRGDDAIRCLEAALRISDAHLPALDALEMAWRERGDLERVAVILGRKVAATARHANRQKPLLSRLGDLQEQLGRPEVALATHQRALEIDPTWRPSLRYVTTQLRDAGNATSAATGFAQLAGELPGDVGVDFAVLSRERHAAAIALSEVVAGLDAEQLRAVSVAVRPALERANVDGVSVAAGLAALRGEPTPIPTSEESTQSGRVGDALIGNALSLRDAANRERASGKLADALATLETANHVSPGNAGVLRELVDIATELGDHDAAARHAAALAQIVTGTRRGEVLLELADIYYDHIEDPVKARDAMRRAADTFGGTRRDATLRMLAAESGAHLAWDVAVDALSGIAAERRTAPDLVQLATALMRAGRDADALVAIDQATATGKLDDGGELLAKVKAEVTRKAKLVHAIERQADVALPAEAVMLRAEALQLRHAIGLTDRKTRDMDLGDNDLSDDDDDSLAEWVDEDDVVDEADLAIPAEPAPAPVLARIQPRKHPSGPPIDITATPREDRDDVLAREQQAQAEPPVLSRTFTRANTEPPPDVSIASEAATPNRAHSDSEPPEFAFQRTPTPRRGSGTMPPLTRPVSQEIPVQKTRASTEPGIVPPRAPDEPKPEDTVVAEAPPIPPVTEPTVKTPSAAERIAALRAATSRTSTPPPPPRPTPPAGTPAVTTATSRTPTPKLGSAPIRKPAIEVVDEPAPRPSVVIAGTRQETANAIASAAASASRDRLLEAYQAHPEDPAILQALLAHLGDREPTLRRNLLEATSRTTRGRTQAIALYELAQLARAQAKDP